ncbi:hypothetical protein [Nocardia sp. NPDC020380]|uniref:hypothetical protein n=1 Tax=Nocardia sp. NPDC020380 TaxID=3364309 RepID=UPI0037B063C2
MAVALHTFRSRSLDDRGWRPDGQATLRTYLITECLYALYDEIRTQRRSEERYIRAVEAVARNESARPDADGYTHPDPVHYLSGHDMLRHELRKLEPRDRYIVWGRAARKTFAYRTPGRDDAREWQLSWLPGRALTRNQALHGMVLDRILGDPELVEDAEALDVAAGAAACLDLTVAEAVVAMTERYLQGRGRLTHRELADCRGAGIER